VLLLQGPVGPFFDRLTNWLKCHGVPTVNRVAFSGGDEWDCNASMPMRFRGALVEWPMFLQYMFTTFKVDCIVLFGQARPHHAKAMVLASLLGIKVVVVEEGYFRPRYLSMELGGVNGYSSTLERYRWPTAQPAPQHVPQVNAWAQSVRMGWYAAVHYALMSWRHARFPFYLHHKNASVVSCIAACDELHTLTSLCGFDALLRGKSVTTYGLPFYAGWGLTTDKAVFPASCLTRRTRQLSLDELVAGALLRYPIYWDHDLKGVTTCMAVLLRIQAQRDALQAQGRLHQLKHGFWRRILRKLRYMYK